MSAPQAFPLLITLEFTESDVAFLGDILEDFRELRPYVKRDGSQFPICLPFILLALKLWNGKLMSPVVFLYHLMLQYLCYVQGCP